MAPNTVCNYGDRALLLECDSTLTVLSVADELRAAALPGVLDIVPGARTLLLTFTDADRLASARRFITTLLITTNSTASAAATERSDAVDVVIDVVYDGADLADVAEHTGLDIADIVEAHTKTPWRVGFGGFAPGFAYLIEGDPRLHVPRRAEPRTQVPAGSVALAGEFSGVYPRESPGGWQLIGHTEATLWDIDRPNPALLTPGIRVQFRAV